MPVRSKQIIKSIAIGMFVFLVATCQAEPELSPYLSFTVPGLDGAIEKIELADIDGDNLAEILACDGHKIVLFSLPDNILFTDTLDSDYPEYEIELADVNRDSVADITIALCYKRFGYDGTECWLVCYDSTRAGTRLVDQVLVDSNYSLCSNIRQVMLKATDLTNDGYNELLFSYERSLYRLPYASVFYWCLTEGAASIYWSYPDSVQAQIDSHIDDLWILPALPGYPAYLTHILAADWSNIGPDYSYSYQHIGVFDIQEEPSVLVWAPGPILGSEDRSKDSELVVGCLIPSIQTATLICSYAFSSSGSWYDTIPHYESASDRGLVAYELHPNDSVVKSWYHSMTDHTFSDFITHPTFPDQFFAIAGDTLMRFSTTDGSLLRRYDDPLPPGMKFWNYPYGGEEPYLVIVNHDTVSYHGFAVVTDVEVEQSDIALPATFTLGQPYPNPFNPTVTLPIALYEKGHLSVEVFNPLGQKVATIHDATTSAGEFDLNWDASEFASGVYLFRATVEDETKTVKAVLLK